MIGAFVLACIFLLGAQLCNAAFVSTPQSLNSQTTRLPCSFLAPRDHRIFMTASSEEANFDMDEDDEEVEPGKMRVSEIKSELSMRGVDFSDCFDKESLVEKLEQARASGKADPKILEDFNKKKLEETFKGEKVEVKDEDIETITANDGKLPGGMSPDTLKQLMANPEVMTLLQSTKMQEAMKLMMSGGREDLEKAMAEDPEIRDVVAELNQVLGGALPS